MIFNSKNEFGSQKQDTQTQTRSHTKTKETPVLVYFGMKLHCCCTLHLAASTEHLRKWRTKMRHLKTGPRNIGSSQSFHIGVLYWSWSWAFFSSLNPSELHTSTSSYRHWHSCYHVVVVLPLTTSATPDGYQCTFVTCVNSEAPISVSSLLQWWICCAQAYDHANTWAVQCDGKRKWRCSRTCQQSGCFETVGDCWATDCSFAKKLWA